MKVPLFAKVYSGYVAIIVGLSLLFFYFSLSAVRAHSIASRIESLERLAGVVAYQAGPLVPGSDHHKLQGFITEVGQAADTRFTVVRPDGVVIADSLAEPGYLEDGAKAPEIGVALQGGVGRAVREAGIGEDDILHVAIPVWSRTNVAAAVCANVPAHGLGILLGELRIRMLNAVLVVMAVSLLGALAVSRMLSRPIAQLASAAGAVAAGDLDTHVDLRNRDELGELAVRFNEMVGRTRSLVNELSQNRDEVNAIIASLREGLLVLSEDGKVVQYNAGFMDVAGPPLKVGAHYMEAIRHPELVKLAERVLAEREPVQRSVQVDERHFLCNGVYAGKSHEAVITLHDITEMVAVARMKRQFVANMSHELRTPLTSIKGFVETLEDHADEEGKRYLAIINRNTQRLINIVEDLLQLSELEREGELIEREAVDLPVLLRSLLHGFDRQLAERGLALELKMADDVPLIEGDAFKLEQLFMNLVDNAVKYTEKGRITITVTRDDERVKIRVEDTGIGIPEKDLPHIFERFYVVDKSRSRNMGGTGLGLSIVKHVVLLHQGKIDVASEWGQGTAFTVWLPVGGGERGA